MCVEGRKEGWKDGWKEGKEEFDSRFSVSLNPSFVSPKEEKKSQISFFFIHQKTLKVKKTKGGENLSTFTQEHLYF